MKIICIGRNYADHAKELNNPLPTKPVFFMKPDTALLKNNEPFYLPDFSNEIHYEAEVVLKVCKNGKHIDPKFSHKYYSEITLGIDFTARDLQQECKEKGLPWEMAKAFDGSAVIGKFVPLTGGPKKFHLDINGERKQKGDTSSMIFSFEQIIAYVSKFVTLKTGDLIFTGTPAGVGAVRISDKLEGFLDEEKMFEFQVK